MRGAAIAANDRGELVVAHLHLVEPIARRLALTLPNTFLLEDLVSAGRLGLLEAARRYSPEDHGGAPFSAYARIRIRGAILDSVRRSAFAEATRPGLADCPEPGALTFTESDVDRETLGVRVSAAIRALPARQRSMILLHYDDGVKVRAIGRRYKVGRRRASEIHMLAIQALRRRLSS